MSKMLLLSKNFHTVSFGVLGGAERILAYVIVWWGKSLSRSKFEAVYYYLSAFYEVFICGRG